MSNDHGAMPWRNAPAAAAGPTFYRNETAEQQAAWEHMNQIEAGIVPDWQLFEGLTPGTAEFDAACRQSETQASAFWRAHGEWQATNPPPTR